MRKNECFKLNEAYFHIGKIKKSKEVRVRVSEKNP